MGNSKLEDTALKFFKKLNVDIDSSNIRDCHWLPGEGSKRVIKSIRKVQKHLKCMDLSSIGIRSTVYINDCLCKYYKIPWRKCKKLCVNKFIHSFWTSNGSIKLKLSDNGRSYIITHINDLEELFPGNECIRDEE